ncbi:LPXTG cell wall anchor domain-containing protein [Pseudarthrobacter sp. BIM B-2242]|uniref:LPXTG cell wall anchor domain-containing protein n=1 Tax=Pseudarthrobacter sp. BIM B-2242 TaxID=2772401 RepID=UPI00168C0A62|nr:LPXTG cell wall anchor domain-containing protein [Pseudarthrobacter sp. BIM B-2242]QOD02644.1 LPXTG cell wall anchor domain-containing protein [Pseudarthrobacter sp. BIM B-2242]
MKKSIAALALAGSIALIGAGPAMAGPAVPYPAPSTGTTVSATIVTPGGTVILTVVSGFTPGETITITITFNGVPQAISSNLGGGASMAVPSKINVLSQTAPESFTVTANEDGGFSTPVTLGAAEGTYTITAVGNESGRSVSQTVTVDASTGSGTGSDLANSGGGDADGAALANTGADSGLVLWTLVGAGALAAGAVSVVVVRRRAKSEAAA